MTIFAITQLQVGMLETLEKLLIQKRSKEFYAKRLTEIEGREVTIAEVEDLLREVRSREDEEDSLDIEGRTIKYNFDGGTVEVQTYYQNPPTPEEVIKDHKIDTSRYKLSAYYSKAKAKGWLVTALFRNIEPQEKYVDEFKEFLKTYSSPHTPLVRGSSDRATGRTLLINKQDVHLNKYDIGGDNDINKRFQEYYSALSSTLDSCGQGILDEIVYVIGSDHFNSEWTGSTVKGTPQSNTHSYQESFKLICDHEVSVINMLVGSSRKVRVVYLGGNHDRFASWHMVTWLQAYFREQDGLIFDTKEDFTKYLSVYDSAICLNHGDTQKFKRLVENFPVAYKKGFANANFHYVITGDKHTERTEEIGGVKCYQIPVQSKAISEWDSQNGYTSAKAEMISFLFKEGKGVNQIIKEVI